MAAQRQRVQTEFIETRQKEFKKISRRLQLWSPGDLFMTRSEKKRWNTGKMLDIK